MRLILCLIAILMLTQPVSAQCADRASCIGQKVEIGVRLTDWAQETKTAMPTSTPRTTKTPIPTATVTDTPKPSATAEPTKTQTPQPVATVTAVPSVTEMVIVPTIAERVGKADPLPMWIRIPLGIAAIVLILFAASGLRKPTTEQ